MQKEKKVISSLAELRFGLANIWYSLEHGEMETSKAKAFAQIGMGMVKAFQAELIQNEILGVQKQIDFLPIEKGLKLGGSPEKFIPEK